MLWSKIYCYRFDRASPLFVAWTQGMPSQKRSAIALRACVILSLFEMLGDYVMGLA